MSHADILALHGEEWSIVLERGERGVPVWWHFGTKADPGRLPKLADLRDVTTFSLDEERVPDVLPLAGLGWFGPTAMALRDASGAALELSFDACEVTETRDSLVIEPSDQPAGIGTTFRYRRLSGGGLEVSTSITNNSDLPIAVDRLASAVLPLPAASGSIVSWRGRHNGELVECCEPMPEHRWTRETRRGIPGHGGPCGAYVMGETAGWHSGLVLAFQLAWSGDARLSIERDDSGTLSVSAEAVFQPGELVLGPGETCDAPPLLVAVSSSGRNGAMAQMHAAIRERISWPGGTMRPRPVHLNSWEAVYFSHDEERIGKLAEAAATLGVERFILDDGWFRARNHDRAGLGDWVADPQKYPQGLAPIAEKVLDLGMEFGLWVEPEMVNPDSDLYRENPHWVLAMEGRERPTARNQLVLDLRREDVRDHLFAQLDRLLSSAPISYLKWDHNRDHAPSGGAAQARGTYALLARLREAHPEVEIESCAGGGGRIDAGIARFTHRFWVSDNIDAVARVPIQRSFLAFMPPELLGSHVGASPSHATGRSQALDFRAAVASVGHFGIELDPATMPSDERGSLQEWIAFWQEWRGLIHGGRTILGEAPDGLLWQAHGRDDELLLWVFRRDHGRDRRTQPVCLPFAEGPDWDIRLLRHAGRGGQFSPSDQPAIRSMKTSPQRFSGSWLAHAGLPIPSLSAESALIYHIKAVS
ncbi:MAG: alpha-galactosidase [Erythrobacter sp.]